MARIASIARGVLVVAVGLGASAPTATAGWRSDRAHLRPFHTTGGAISPKSVVASQHGLLFAQNMMYRHTITVYDRRGRLVKTISDAVRLARFGIGGHPGVVHGAPVEVAFSPSGRYAYVSNYWMEGAGFHRPGDDVCDPANGYDDSYLYRIDVRRLAIDRVTRVGATPKYVAVTPDGRRVLVSNWCSYTLSVVDARRSRELRQIPLGAYPRGIVVTPDGRRAYVAVMGSQDIASVDLRTYRVSWLRDIGSAPRHLVLSPTARYLYATLNGEGAVVKIDLSTRRVIRRAATGSLPRSMTIAPDGRAVYVVNYGSGTVSKLRAGDLRVLQTVRTNPQPIGITYDDATHRLWVACYSGSLMGFSDG